MIFSSRHRLLGAVLLALSASAASAQTRTPAPLPSPPATPPQGDAALAYSTSTRLPAAEELPNDPAFPPQTAAAPEQQNSTPPANETDAARKAREQREEGEREVKKQEKQRVGGVLPLFNVVISGKTVPLTPAQKFSLSLHTIIDPYTIGLAVIVGGGFGEINDSHPGYGWGPAGLFKRIGASYADNAIGNVVGNAVLPTVLHQDPRYYRKGQGSVISRIVYSAMTSFICYGDNGKKQFNISNIGGNLIAGSISNLYYPSNERGVSLSLQNAATVTYEGMLGAQILEFTPDLQEYVHKRREHHRQVLAAAAAAANGTTPPPSATPPPAPPPAAPGDNKPAPPAQVPQ